MIVEFFNFVFNSWLSEFFCFVLYGVKELDIGVCY